MTFEILLFGAVWALACQRSPEAPARKPPIAASSDKTASRPAPVANTPAAEPMPNPGATPTPAAAPMPTPTGNPMPVATPILMPPTANPMPVATPIPMPPPTNPMQAATGPVVGGYYPNWTESPMRLRDIPSAYNLIYIFAAKPVGGPPGTTGAVSWTMPGNGKAAATHFREDLAFIRSQEKRVVILSVGGAGQGMSFPTRAKSQVFLDSIIALHKDLGGFDGLDWNTFEADQAPDTEEMIWISKQLKSKFPGFLISAPPAPWNKRDKEFCAAMVKAGAMDYVAPQYYDGPELATPAFLKKNVEEWVALIGAERLVVGLGVWNKPNYWTIADATASWKEIKAKHPKIRGAFQWSILLDEEQDFPFAKQLAPLVK